MKHPNNTVDELCIKGNLEKFRTTLERILKRLVNEGCYVSTRYDEEYSNLEYSMEQGYRIRVSLKNVKDPLDIIWKLLHEYGHFLSGAIKPNDATMAREELAWKHADKLFEEFPEFLPYLVSYNRCKEECLKSYRKRFTV